MGETLADPLSLLGQLQRGRGAGFRAALSADPGVVAPLLLACILHDPRFDRQCESRADYYARLAIHVHLPLAPLEEYLQSHAGAHPWSYSHLPLDVLGRLACRGNDEAAAILMRYLSYGPRWTEAFEAMVGSGHAPRPVRELGRVILERFPDEAALTEEIEGAMLDPRVWDQWASTELRVAPIIVSLRAQAPFVRPTDESIHAGIDPAWDVSALLSQATHDTAIVFGQVAAERAGPRDLPVLLGAFFGDDTDTVRLRVTSQALTILKLPEALPPLVRFVEDFDGHEDAPRAQYRIGCVRRILAATPEALPIARAWLSVMSRARQSVAVSILEEQSEEADVPPLRTLLASALDREPDDYVAVYLVEGCLKALAPFAARIPYAELTTVFERTRSMWNRRGAAELMADVYQEAFAGSYAVECLWDCESDLIEVGCVYANLSMPTVRDRLKHLRHSPYEGDDVRSQAEKRLQAAAP